MWLGVQQCLEVFFLLEAIWLQKLSFFYIEAQKDLCHCMHKANYNWSLIFMLLWALYWISPSKIHVRSSGKTAYKKVYIMENTCKNINRWKGCCRNEHQTQKCGKATNFQCIQKQKHNGWGPKFWYSCDPFIIFQWTQQVTTNISFYTRNSW